MNDQPNRNRPALHQPEVLGPDFSMAGEMHVGFNTPATTGQGGAPTTTADSTFGTIITAQRVAVPRNVSRVLENLKVLCAMAGSRYVYSWEVNDRQNRRKQTIEGPTIKLANDLVRTYGNCTVDVRAFDEGTHIMFYARFTDLETGFSLTRPFQQRKSQGIGMKDADRQADIVFQIGASKAIRNVVVNALGTFSDFMVEESKKNLLGWVENNREKAAAFVQKTAEKHEIALLRIESVVGRKVKDWTVKDLARVMMELRAVDDGMAVADEIYPALEDAAEVMKEKAQKAEGEQPKRQSRKKQDPEAQQQDPQGQQAEAGQQQAGADGQGQQQEQGQQQQAPEPEPEPEPDPAEGQPSHPPANGDDGEEDASTLFGGR